MSRPPPRSSEAAPTPGAYQAAGVEGGGGGCPVDCGVPGPVAAMVMLACGDVPGEVAAAQECVVADEQFDGGLVRVDAAGAGTQGFREPMLRCQVTGHGVRPCRAARVAGARPAMR